MKVFMDDFSIYGLSFDACLENLSKVLERRIETDLVLNWEKCYFMVDEGIVLEHLVSSQRIDVDRVKVEVIKRLPPPKHIRGVRSLLGHARLYRRFMEDLSKIVRPLTNLLCKDAEFVFDEASRDTFKRYSLL